ncbi:hypothetical protein ACQP3J_32365, partial [Escherichia coli]
VADVMFEIIWSSDPLGPLPVLKCFGVFCLFVCLFLFFLKKNTLPSLKISGSQLEMMGGVCGSAR